MGERDSQCFYLECNCWAISNIHLQPPLFQFHPHHPFDRNKRGWLGEGVQNDSESTAAHARFLGIRNSSVDTMTRLRDGRPRNRASITGKSKFNHSLHTLLTYLLTPWSRVLLEKLTGSAASQEIPRIFGTPRFITVLTSARHLSLS